MGEAVADEAKLALLRVLLDGVEDFVFGDLGWRGAVSVRSGGKSSATTLR